MNNLICFKDLPHIVRDAVFNDEKVVFHPLGQCLNNKNPLPKIIHHFWLANHDTKNSRSKEVSEKDFSLLLEQYKHLSGKGFEYFFWIDDENMIPKTMEKLKHLEENIQIKSINELKGQSKSIEFIQNYLEHGIYGVAIDAMKYEVLKLFGGVVLDLNFNITADNFEDFFSSYSFFITSGIELRAVVYENFIIGSVKGHPIMNEVSDRVHEYITTNSPYESDRIKKSLSNGMHTHKCYNLLTEAVHNNFSPNREEGIYEEIFCMSNHGGKHIELLGSDPAFVMSWDD